ncbi:MAG: hypothetical protein U0531_08150 [Dehalococcoidia bacterium]
MVADRHIEIIQLYRDLFDCDGALLRVFLDAYGWPADVDFPRKALGYALLRQALGLAHTTRWTCSSRSRRVCRCRRSARSMNWRPCSFPRSRCPGTSGPHKQALAVRWDGAVRVSLRRPCQAG